MFFSFNLIVLTKFADNSVDLQHYRYGEERNKNIMCIHTYIHIYICSSKFIWTYLYNIFYQIFEIFNVDNDYIFLEHNN